MSWIYVDFEGMNYINAGFSTAISQMCVLKSKYQRIVEGCDAELLYETEVSVAIEQISRALGKHIEALKQLQKGMTYAYISEYMLSCGCGVSLLSNAAISTVKPLSATENAPLLN